MGHFFFFHQISYEAAFDIMLIKGKTKHVQMVSLLTKMAAMPKCGKNVGLSNIH